MEVMQERRSRPKKGIVVFIDEDSHICDRVACRLEADGYHVLTALDIAQGLALVEGRKPDAVVWSDGGTGDHRWSVCHFVRSPPPRRRAVFHWGGPSVVRKSQQNAGYLGVQLVRQSSNPEQLAAVLNELIEGPTVCRLPRAKRR
jgi:hypothetical protein